MNSCDEIQSKIESYIDNEISSIDKIHIEKHILSCPKCTQKHAELLVLSDMFSSVEEQDVPDTFASNFHDKLVQEKNLLKKGQKISKIIKFRNFAYAASFFFVLFVFARFGYFELFQKMYQTNQEKEMFRSSNTITTTAQPILPLSDSLERAAPPQTNSSKEMGASSQDKETSQGSSKNLNPNPSETNQSKTKKLKENDSVDSSKKSDFSIAQEAPIQPRNAEVVPKTASLNNDVQEKASSSTQSIMENDTTLSTTQKSSVDLGKPLIRSETNASAGTNQLSNQPNTEVSQQQSGNENMSSSSSARIASSAEQENAGAALESSTKSADVQDSLAVPTLVSLDISTPNPDVIVNQILTLAKQKKWSISLDSPPSSPMQVMTIPFATLPECESFIQTLHQSGIKGVTKAPSNEDALVAKEFALIISISKP